VLSIEAVKGLKNGRVPLHLPDDKWKAPIDYENLNHLKALAFLMREGYKKETKHN